MFDSDRCPSSSRSHSASAGTLTASQIGAQRPPSAWAPVSRSAKRFKRTIRPWRRRRTIIASAVSTIDAVRSCRAEHADSGPGRSDGKAACWANATQLGVCPHSRIRSRVDERHGRRDLNGGDSAGTAISDRSRPSVATGGSTAEAVDPGSAAKRRPGPGPRPARASGVT